MSAEQQPPMDGNKYHGLVTAITNQAITEGACTPAQIISTLEVVKATVINKLLTQQKSTEIVIPNFRMPNGGRQ